MPVLNSDRNAALLIHKDPAVQRYNQDRGQELVGAAVAALQLDSVL